MSYRETLTDVSLVLLIFTGVGLMAYYFWETMVRDMVLGDRF